jgi:hypothetical protein
VTSALLCNERLEKCVLENGLDAEIVEAIAKIIFVNNKVSGIERSGSTAT